MRKIMSTSKKGIMVVLIILVCMVFLFTSSSSVEAKRDKIVLAWSKDANTLDPHDVAGHHTSANIAHIYEGLVVFDEQMNVHPLLAESWETKDAQTWTFKLRRGVKFHDGTPFNAEAVKYSVDRWIADRDPYTKRSLTTHCLVTAIKECKVINDHTVQIITKYSFGPLIYTMCDKQICIISPTAHKKYKADFGDNPVGGTGPYKFVSWRKGDRITLERFDEYWGNRIQPINRPKRVVIRAIPEDAARVMALETGEVDVCTFVPIFEIDRLKKNPQILVREMPSMTVIYFGMNQMVKPFNDVRVRKALNYALDKESITKYVMQGHSMVPNCVTAPTAIWHAPGVPYNYNPAKAKKLLAEAGYPNGFKTSILVSFGKYTMDKEFVEVARKNFREVGVETELEAVEWATHSARLTAPPDKKDYKMWLRAWSPGSGESSHTLRSTMHSDAIIGGWNWSVYKNQEVDRLIEQAQAEPNHDEAGRMLAQVQRIVTEQAVWIPVVIPNQIVAIHKDVHGVEVWPTEPVVVKNAYIE